MEETGRGASRFNFDQKSAKVIQYNKYQKE